MVYATLVLANFFWSGFHIRSVIGRVRHGLGLGDECRVEYGGDDAKSSALDSRMKKPSSPADVPLDSEKIV